MIQNEEPPDGKDELDLNKFNSDNVNCRKLKLTRCVYSCKLYYCDIRNYRFVTNDVIYENHINSFIYTTRNVIIELHLFVLIQPHRKFPSVLIARIKNEREFSRTTERPLEHLSPQVTEIDMIACFMIQWINMYLKSI